MLDIDENGLLFFYNDCNFCMEFPIENPDERCLKCGYTLMEKIMYENHADKMNALYLASDEGENVNGEAIIRMSGVISNINMGSASYDTVTVQDYFNTHTMRQLAPYAGKLADIIVIPKHLTFSPEPATIYVDAQDLEELEEDDED